MNRRLPSTEARDVIALTLAIGMCTALNLVTLAILYDAIRHENAGISENATQILTGWGGGIIGILGAVFGYRAGASTMTTTTEPGTGSAPSLTPDSTEP